MEERQLGELENNISTIVRANNVNSTVIYQGGTENEPATISTNQRIEIDNPYPNHIVYCMIQIKFNGKWGGTGFVFGGSGYGISAKQLTGENYDKIIIQTGDAALTASSIHDGNSFGVSSAITSAPYRVVILCLN